MTIPKPAKVWCMFFPKFHTYSSESNFENILRGFVLRPRRIFELVGSFEKAVKNIKIVSLLGFPNQSKLKAVRR